MNVDPRAGFLAVFLWFGGAVAQTPDPLLDYSPLAPPQAERLKLAQPAVSWLVRPDAAQYCEQINGQDGAAVWHEGCVAWSRSASTCTIVTTGKTTHSQLGRLFLACLSAGESS